MNKNQKAAGEYNEDSLFQKIASVAKKTGITIIYAVLILYNTMQKPSTPNWARMTIVAALAYFISPIDLFPDVLPGGFTDDMGVILGALVAVAMHIDDESKSDARKKLHDWFGEYDESTLSEIDDKLHKKQDED